MRNVPLPARPNDPNPKKRFLQEVIVILGDDIQNDYDVEEEAFPDNLPSQYQSKKITWVSNFKLIKKPGVTRTPGKKIKYTIELDKGDGSLVYFDGKNVQPLTTRKAGNQRVKADLKTEDPPVGWIK